MLGIEPQIPPAQGQDAARAYIRELQAENQRLREQLAETERERRRIAAELGQVLAELELAVRESQP